MQAGRPPAWQCWVREGGWIDPGWLLAGCGPLELQQLDVQSWEWASWELRPDLERLWQGHYLLAPVLLRVLQARSVTQQSTLQCPQVL